MISKGFKEFIDTIDANFESEDLLIKDWVGSKTYGEDDDANISKISNLKISMIKLTKIGDDSEFCNTFLLEQIHLFNDDIYDIAIKLREDTGNLNIVVEEEEEKENNNNVDDGKPTNTKELIQNTINKHNDKPIKNKEIKNKEIKKDDDKYINKNHLTIKMRRGGLDTDDDINNRRELTKIDEYDRETKREQNKRVYFF